MDTDMVLYIGKRAMETTMLVSAPVLLATLIVGVVAAMLQAVTSIRDMTAGMVLKLACVGVTLLVFGGWMMQMTVAFTLEVFNQVTELGLAR